MPAPRPAPDTYLALADQTRRRIIELLSKEELTVNDLTDRLPVRQPTVSEHLAILRSVGLVSAEKDGRRRIYRLRAESLADIRAWLRRVATTAPTPHASPADPPARKARPPQPPPSPGPTKRDDWAVWD